MGHGESQQLRGRGSLGRGGGNRVGKIAGRELRLPAGDRAGVQAGGNAKCLTQRGKRAQVHKLKLVPPERNHRPMICRPESTNRTFPVTPRPRLLARKTAASATSAGSVLRRNGARWLTESSMLEE